MASVLSFDSFSQEERMRDTIFITEVNVLKSDRGNTKFKNKGSSTGLVLGKIFKGIASRYDDFPQGRLSTVTFTINKATLNLVKRKVGIKYQKAEFKLLIMSVAEDGSMGEPLLDAPVIVKVDADHRGKMTLDLSTYDVRVPSSVYIGLEAIGDLAHGSFTIGIVFNDNTKTYQQMKTDGKWYLIPQFELKLEAEVRR